MGLLTLSEVRAAGQSYSAKFRKSSASVLQDDEASFSEKSHYQIFLSHSFTDADSVVGLKAIIESLGHSVYVDWMADPQLDRSKVSPATAEQLRNRMRSCGSLFFVVSDNSPTSKWMPWELGYFDALRKKVAILPLVVQPGRMDFKGQEYLGLYPYVTRQLSTNKVDMLWIRWDIFTYVSFNSWLQGEEPFKH